MDVKRVAYAVNTRKTVNEATESVLREVEKAGWTVFGIHDIQERLAAKGFPQKPLKIIEICSGKYADAFLNKNRLVSLCMPCKINVFESEGKTVIAGMNPEIASEFFPEIPREQARAAAEELKGMVDAAR